MAFHIFRLQAHYKYKVTSLSPSWDFISMQPDCCWLMTLLPHVIMLLEKEHPLAVHSLVSIRCLS